MGACAPGSVGAGAPGRVGAGAGAAGAGRDARLSGMTQAPAAELELVRRIHATAPRMTMDFAGAGAQALAWLHAVGGSSRTILEATDRYAPASLVEAVGGVPERFTSPEVARALAAHALARARALAPEGGPLFGVGLTATIATDREKRGAHRLALATRDGLGTATYGLELAKGARDRAGEEALVSRLVLRAVADACGVLGAPPVRLLPGERLERGFEPEGLLARFVAGEIPWLLQRPDGTPSRDGPGPAALLSGSFHPLHEGHRRLAAAAAAHSGREVVFELPIANADKAAITPFVARRRAAQFLGRAPVLLSRAPLFVDKARLWPGVLFVVGADTAERLTAPRFYDGDPARAEAALAELRAAGARFLVAVRRHRGRLMRLADARIPPAYRDLFEELPESVFRLDLSSTELRRAWEGAGEGTGEGTGEGAAG